MGSTIPLISDSIVYYEFPDAENRLEVSGQMDIPEFWIDGALEFEIFYTGTASSTNNIRWGLAANSCIDAADLFATPEVDVEQNMPGPATAEFLTRGTFTTRLTIESDDRIAGFTISRNGTHADDTYAGTARFVGILITYKPSKL